MSMKLPSHVAPGLSRLALVSFAALAGVGAQAATISGASAGLFEMWIAASDARPDDGIPVMMQAIDPARQTRVLASVTLQDARGGVVGETPTDQQAKYLPDSILAALTTGSVRQTAIQGDSGALALVDPSGAHVKAWTDAAGQMANAAVGLSTTAGNGTDFFNLLVGPGTRLQAGAGAYVSVIDGGQTANIDAGAQVTLRQLGGGGRTSLLDSDAIGLSTAGSDGRSLALDWTNAGDTPVAVRLNFGAYADVFMSEAAAVPEPASLALTACAVMALVASRRQRRA